MLMPCLLPRRLGRVGAACCPSDASCLNFALYAGKVARHTRCSSRQGLRLLLPSLPPAAANVPPRSTWGNRPALRSRLLLLCCCCRCCCCCHCVSASTWASSAASLLHGRQPAVLRRIRCRQHLRQQRRLHCRLLLHAALLPQLQGIGSRRGCRGGAQVLCGHEMGRHPPARRVTAATTTSCSLRHSQGQTIYPSHLHAAGAVVCAALALGKVLEGAGCTMDGMQGGAGHAWVSW